MSNRTDDNERAWARYMGSRTFQTHREDFDNGWDAALSLAAATPNLIAALQYAQRETCLGCGDCLICQTLLEV